MIDSSSGGSPGVVARRQLLDDVAATVRTRVPVSAIAGSVATCLVLPRAVDLSIAVPLNEVGARTAFTVVLAFVWVLPWMAAFTRELPWLDRQQPRRARQVRAWLVGTAMAAALAAGLAALGAGRPWGAQDFVIASGSFLGAALIGCRLIPGGAWLVPLVLLSATLVFGVDRQRTAPWGWAWLLSAGEGSRPTHCLVAGALFVAGAVVFAVRSPQLSAGAAAG